MDKLRNKLTWIYSNSRSYIPAILIIMLIGALLSGTNVLRALVMKKVIDSAVSTNINLIIKSLVTLGIVILSDILLQGLNIFLSTRTYVKMQNNLEKSIYSHVIHSNWFNFSKYHSGDIATRISSDSNMITTMIVSTIPSILSAGVLLISSFIILFKFAPTLAIIAFLLSPLLILLGKIYSKKLKFLYKQSQETESKYRSFIYESIQNLIIVKSFTNEDDSLNKMDNFQAKKLELAYSQNKINIFNNSVLSASSWIIFFITFIWGAFNLSSGTVTFGTISALIQLFNNIQYPLTNLVSSVPKTIATTASVDRLMELEDLPLDKHQQAIANNLATGIELINVSFNYTPDNIILDDVSFKLNPGEIVALVGASGQGKTTLIRLILSLINPQEGSLNLNNKYNELSIDASARKLISYVPQGNTLFSGTLGENLRYGNKSASIDDLWAAVEAASIDDLVRDLKDCFDTMIGERGLGLSEGQAQRIALARAFIKKAPILILDEATSALDVETELKVLHSIQRLEEKPLCIIITHRPSALAICDRVLKLEDGVIVELDKELELESAAEMNDNIQKV